MTVYLMAGTLLLLVLVQAFVPFFVKKTEVFGIYVPAEYSQQPSLVKMKKRYAVLVSIIGIAAAAFYLFEFSGDAAAENAIALWGIGLQFGVVLFSMGLYLFFHLQVKAEKQRQQWTVGKKAKVIVDLQFRRDLEMIAGVAFLLPVIVTCGLIFYTLSTYGSLPARIPVHWGPSGEPDRFTDKNVFTSLLLLIVLLILQIMFYAINRSLKESGAKIRASGIRRSRERELISRKYGSWLLFIAALASTLLLGNLQLSIIHPEMGGSLWTLSLIIGFLIVVLGAAAVYTFKVVNSGSEVEELPADPDIMNADDDRYWKAGVFYFNREDPSVMVEKRFGIGWTVNFGNPKSWLIFLLPLVFLLGIALAVSF